MEAREYNPQSSTSCGHTLGAQVLQKNVSIAPPSRLLAECHYKVRRPLFTTQQHISILKTTTGADSKEQSNTDPSPAGMRPLHSPQTRRREDQPLLHKELFPSGSRSRMSPLTSNRPSHLRPHNSVLQVHRMSTPVRPPLSSPVLHPRYTPLSSHRRAQTEQTTSTPYQAEYWACAIPKDPPPTPLGRDPHQDYEGLLDYTYPLRSAQVGDWTLQDSGIEVDHLSTSLSELNLSFGGMESKDPVSIGPSSPDLLGSLFPATPSSPADRPEWSKQKNTMVSSISSALITLPWEKGLQEEEEFRPLPEKIELLQQLSRQVIEAAAILHPAHWDSAQTHCPPIAQDSRDTAQAHLRTEDLHHLWTEDLVDSLRGPEQHSSLMEHISVFCRHLEQLVRWLYTASQKIERLAPPTVDIHSVKSSLAQYKNFQQDVNSHMPLTSSVLQTGRLLLSCIHSTSPVLRETLLLIESQSRLLERHTENFFSSILSAMDSLTQPHTDEAQTGSEKGEEPKELSPVGEH
ncbi:centrosomal protein of 68 kDa [Boleophthalmus pectinirostris]|uniref:centrosomal protein of 68 kDa n=1 Tax=Boleophthalmus pectinirostris TaxID=150288 RepID=UPI0024327E3D|nr:centrosomal protein of 68 kDa [Boleophthalmus pectinirostris]